jgi:hypothetical protein
MIDEITIKSKLEEIFEQPIIKVLKYSIDRNGEYLITFTYEDKKYNQIIEANLTLPERIFN